MVIARTIENNFERVELFIQYTLVELCIEPMFLTIKKTEVRIKRLQRHSGDSAMS